jgi:hypothetical protein
MASMTMSSMGMLRAMDGSARAADGCRRVTISTYVKNPQAHALFRRHYLSLIA